MSKGSPLFKQLAQAYRRAAIDYPQLKAVTLAQWALESGWGTSDLAVKHYNFGGLKYRPEMAAYAGKVLYKGEDYCKFASLEKFLQGYWAFLRRSPYAGWEQRTASAAVFINFIGPIYCPGDSDYGSHILSLLPDAEELLQDEEAEAGPPPGTGRSPEAEAELRQKPVKKFAIDPGHGMSNRRPGVYDPGATHTEEGIQYEEAAMALKYGLTLRDVLRARGQEVFLTRDEAQDPAPVGQRAAYAEEAGCEVFLSLHLNDYDDAAANGLEVLYRDDEDAQLAGKLHDALSDLTGIRPRGIKQRTDLAVLKFIGPAVLIELGFIANDHDRDILLNPAKRDAICQKIADVIMEHLA